MINLFRNRQRFTHLKNYVRNKLGLLAQRPGLQNGRVTEGLSEDSESIRCMNGQFHFTKFFPDV